MGGKKRATAEVRKQVPIKMTDDEHSLLVKAAELENLPTGTWIRTTALKAAKQVVNAQR